MKKIAISGFFGDDNVGDDLLQLAVVKGIQSQFKNARIAIFTSNTEKNIELFKREGIDYKSFNILYSGRWGIKEPTKKGIRSYLWIIENLKELRKCDIQLIGPGNIIKDNTNKFLASFWILRGFLSYLLGKSFAFIAIGVADVNYFHSKFLIKKIVNKARFITTRDKTSLEKLRRFEVNSPHLISFPDLTYTLIDKKKSNSIKKTEKIQKIGLNVANFSLKFFPDHVIENYRNIVLEFLKRLADDSNYEFLFFSFSSEFHFNDNIMCEFLSVEMRKYQQDIYNCSYNNINELKERISTCDAFIGTRFHSVIFAIQGCVPTLAMSYDWKAQNFMNEAGLGDYVLNINNLSINKLLYIWDNLCENYLTYYIYLEKLNSAYHELSLKHFETLKKYI